MNVEVEVPDVIQTLLEQGLSLFPKAGYGIYLSLDRERGCYQYAAEIGYPFNLLHRSSFPQEDLFRLYLSTMDHLGEGIYIGHGQRAASGIGPTGGKPQPKSKVAMLLPEDRLPLGVLVLGNLENANAFRHSDIGKLQRFREQSLSAVIRAVNLHELRLAQKRLLKAAHLSGIAETSAHVLHNLGNGLNGVNTVASCMGDRTAEIDRYLGLLARCTASLADLMRTDEDAMEKQETLVHGLQKIQQTLSRQNQLMIRDGSALCDKVHQIIGILREQDKKTQAAPFFESVDLNRLVGATARAIADRPEFSHIELVESFGDIPPVSIIPTRFTAMLEHLMINASEALAGLPKRGRIELETSKQDGKVVLKIIDNGRGVPVENQVRVFSQGFSTRGKGRGIGLHYCANAIKEMFGSIRIESAGEYSGTRVEIVLPTGRTPQASLIKNGGVQTVVGELGNLR